MLPDQLVDAFAFSAEHEHRRSVVLRAVVVVCSPLVETVYPETSLFKVLQCPRHVPNPNHSYVLKRTRRGLRDRVGQAGRAPFGNQDRVRTGGIGGADDRPEVVWILHAVEKDKQPGVFGYFVDFSIPCGSAECDHTLVRLVRGRPVQHRTRLKSDLDVLLAAEIYDLLDSGTARSFGYQDPVEGPSGPQRLADRVDSNQEAHRLMLLHKNRAAVILPDGENTL